MLTSFSTQRFRKTIRAAKLAESSWGFGTANKDNNRAALLVRCSKDEAKAIREAAKEERRTISAFMLNVVCNDIEKRQEKKRRAAARQEKAKQP